MSTICESVAERVALGEPLGDLAAHAASCEHCRTLIDLPAKLGATRHEVDPGLGFAARMTVGAQSRIVARRRRRVATGLAATVAAGALAVFVFTRAPETTEPDHVATDTTPPTPDPVVAPTTDEDLAALIHLSDVDRSSRLSADWGEIKKPLRPYRKLLQGVMP